MKYYSVCMASSLEITQLLHQVSAGQRDALDNLLPLVYDELRHIAQGQLRRERVGHTLNTTALVHEAYLKLCDQDRVDWQNRAHFFAVAAQAMRRILVDYARHRNREKRGGGVAKVSFEEGMGLFSDDQSEALLALDEALQRLEAINDRHGRVVECRFFGGLTIEETATALDISTATVARDWQMARAWLKREMQTTA